MKKLALIIGARPNLIKAGPLYREFKTIQDLDVEIINTGQHYDRDLNDVMEQDFYLDSHKIGQLTDRSDDRWVPVTCLALIEMLQEIKPDAVMVLGDTDSAVAGALTAEMMGIPLIHYEAGLRIKHQRTVEDRNRRLIDQLADLYFPCDKESMLNLVHENRRGQIYIEGNLMIDSLRMHEVWNCKRMLSRYSLDDGEYFLMTLHRKENQDVVKLQEIFTEIHAMDESGTNVVWVQHPSMMAFLDRLDIVLPRCIAVDPLNYSDFHSLMAYSKGVITDSGGIPAECAYYEKPCVYLRDETEWQSLRMHNVMRIVGLDAVMFTEAIDTINKGEWGDIGIPEYWDGHSAGRIAHKVRDYLYA